MIVPNVLRQLTNLYYVHTYCNVFFHFLLLFHSFSFAFLSFTDVTLPSHRRVYSTNGSNEIKGGKEKKKKELKIRVKGINKIISLTIIRLHIVQTADLNFI